jgi:hypothetical protein
VRASGRPIGVVYRYDSSSGLWGHLKAVLLQKSGRKARIYRVRRIRERDIKRFLESHIAERLTKPGDGPQIFSREGRNSVMDTVEIRSTSLHSAECSDFIVRDGNQTRLIFRASIVDNPSDRDACVRGRFLYQRKGKNDVWVDFDKMALSSLKKGEQFQLELKAGELLPLLKNLGGLYRIHQKQGVPHGRTKFIKIGIQLAKLLEVSEPELNEFLSGNRSNAINTLQRVLKWLAKSPGAPEALVSAEGELPELNALVGLANLRAVVQVWSENSTNDDENFWQLFLSKYAFVLAQIFAYPVVVIKDKAYVGGKRIDNSHGNLVDFLARVNTTGTAVLIEIKTPRTDLLGGKYRDDVFPPSRELTGAISQVLKYRESLMQEGHALMEGQGLQMSGADPRCIVIAGCAVQELADENRRRSFERFRERLSGVILITFDEVFDRIQGLIHLLETPPADTDEDEDPFA